MGLVYERNLPHQEAAIKAVLEAFEGASLKQTNLGILQDSRINPILELDLRQKELNLRHLQERQRLEKSIKLHSNVYDLMIKTGIGKTYTYTKLAFELYQNISLENLS